MTHDWPQCFHLKEKVIGNWHQPQQLWPCWNSCTTFLPIQKSWRHTIHGNPTMFPRLASGKGYIATQCFSIKGGEISDSAISDCTKVTALCNFTVAQLSWAGVRRSSSCDQMKPCQHVGTNGSTSLLVKQWYPRFCPDAATILSNPSLALQTLNFIIIFPFRDCIQYLWPPLGSSIRSYGPPSDPPKYSVLLMWTGSRSRLIPMGPTWSI